MTDRDALLAAITANPDEDTPRLVYADWLQEHDEADRAEFIRVQCRLEHVSRRSAEGKQLAKREKELQAKLFGHLDALGFAALTFRRGFVGTVTAGLLHFRDNAAALTAEDAPAFWLKLEEDERDSILWESDFEDYATAVGELGDRAELRRCVALDLPCLGMDPASYFFESDHLTNLRRLNFPDNEAGPNVEAVASPTFANLRWANFHNSNSAGGRPSITPFAECPHLADLEYLDFGSNAQWNDNLEALAQTPYLARLRYLDVSSSSFGPNSLNRFFGISCLPALRGLNLSASFDSFGDADSRDANRYAEWLAGSLLLVRLSRLWLGSNNITDDGAKALAASPRDVKLELLDLSGNPIGPAGKQALRKRFGKDVCVFG
jgi:uncharacterized protein (TIGR02996 family)